MPETIAQAASTWSLTLLRLTVFSAPTGKPDPSWWQTLFDRPAENRTERNRGIECVETNPWESGQLSFGWNPTRRDCVYSATPEQEASVVGAFILGSFSDIRHPFSHLTEKWLDHLPDLTRVAVGGIFELDATDKEEAYLKLKPFLPAVELDPVGSRDFFYQINRPRLASKLIDPLVLNRLSKWAVVAYHRTQILIDSQGQTTTPLGDAIFRCRLETDINTAHDYPGPIAKEKLRVVLHQMMDLTDEILQKGDTK